MEYLAVTFNMKETRGLRLSQKKKKVHMTVTCKMSTGRQKGTKLQ